MRTKLEIYVFIALKESECVHNKLDDIVYTFCFLDIGCNVNGVCKGEGSIWTEQSTCVDYKCLKETRNRKIYMIKSPVAVGMLVKYT